jgi:hypothetical protein
MPMPSRTDQMLSRGLGKMKAMKAAIEGLRGVFKTLTEQHGEVAALLRRLKADESKRADLWPKIRIELLSHERGEQREVYPVLLAHAETRPLAEQHDREAGELEGKIDRLQSTAFTAPEWGQLFGELVDLVQSHVKEEEDIIFPRAQETIGEQVAKELEPKFLAAKKAIMEAS